MPANTSKNSGYLDLRVRLIRRGYTLRSFALQHGYSVPTVYCAAKGSRKGIVATRIAKHLKTFAYATPE
jgi:hypothetical protein